MLHEDFYHVAILDINLEDDKVQDNKDGLVLLRKLDEKGC